MELPFTETDESVLDTYRRVHGNGEQTHVAVLSAGESRYVAVAYDIDPVELAPGAAECVAYDPTLEGVRERARRWMERNPKGVIGDAEDGGSGRLTGSIIKGLKKMNDYGNQQVEQVQEQQNQQGGQH